MGPNPQESGNLVKFMEEILNRKLETSFAVERRWISLIQVMSGGNHEKKVKWKWGYATLFLIFFFFFFFFLSKFESPCQRKRPITYGNISQETLWVPPRWIPPSGEGNVSIMIDFHLMAHSNEVYQQKVIVT